MPSAICFNLGQSKILSSGNGLKVGMSGKGSNESRARSDCTYEYVQADLALQYLQS